VHPACPDFDLCEKCETSPNSVHPASHPMLKTKVPLRIDAQAVIDGIQDLSIGNPSSYINSSRSTCRVPAEIQSMGHMANHTGLVKTSATRRADPRWTPAREHVTLSSAQPATDIKAEVIPEPVLNVPGSYVQRNLYDQEEASANLAAPITPDNRVEIDEGEAKVLGRLNEAVATVENAARAISVERPVDVVVAGVKHMKIDENEEVADETCENKREVLGVAEVVQEKQKEPVTPLDIFSWVRHVTIPSGCTLPAGAEFTKTWKLKHFASGAEFDFEKVKLVHKSEGVLGEQCKSLIEYKRNEIEDEKEIEVSLRGLKVPNIPGEIMEHWRFEDDAGIAYGQPLRLRLVICFPFRTKAKPCSFTVEGEKSADASMNSSAVIMPRSTAESASSTPVTRENIETALSSPSTKAMDTDGSSSVMSFTDDESFIDVSDAGAATTEDAEAEARMRAEYDMVDEDEEALTGDEL
jgi:next-to-BRCA1 protein 1